MQPFSITLFATSGDPEGIRHVDKSNWSGYGVVFNKELFPLLKQEPGFSQAGIYILVGNAAEETIYIGEADPVGDRLKNHVSNKDCVLHWFFLRPRRASSPATCWCSPQLKLRLLLGTGQIALTP
jgi:hypothetical protein